MDWMVEQVEGVGDRKSEVTSHSGLENLDILFVLFCL